MWKLAGCRAWRLLAGAVLLALGACVTSAEVTCTEETCAPGLVCAPSGKCTTEEALAACAGLPTGEACDPENPIATCVDGVCEVTCGDGVVDEWELCDVRDASDGEAPCRDDCRSRLTCGDGVVEGVEICDCGGTSGTVATDLAEACQGLPNGVGFCSVACQRIDCGNDILDPSEACDDGNLDGGDGCSFDCRVEVCGNGPPIEYAAGEQCDDGNQVEGDGCQADCQLPVCGDGVVDEDRGEECDDANQVGGDGCAPDCRIERCGNGPPIEYQAGEQCDDGNDLEGDGCQADCQLPVCGDGVIDLDEECDDDNLVGGDGCAFDCRLEVCGNGVTDVAVREECDDGDRRSHDGCSSGCRIERLTWRDASAAVPRARAGAALAYDPLRERIVLFGGQGYDGFSVQPFLADTWEWDGTAWLQRSGSVGPSARRNAAFAYSAVDRRLVLFGGTNGTYLGDTWTWDGTTWTRVFPAVVPPARASAGAAPMGAGEGVFMFGGRGGGATWLDDTWVFRGGEWRSVLAPSPTKPGARELPAAGLDPRREVIVLAGGRSQLESVDLGDTWEWSIAREEWILLASGSSPVAAGGDLVWDGAHGALRLIVPGPATTTGHQWDGSAWTTTPETERPPQVGPAAYDAARRQIVAFGASRGVSAPSADATTRTRTAAVVGAGASWASRAQAVPGDRSGAAVVYARALGGAYLYGGVFPDTSLWWSSGGSWRQVTPPLGTSNPTPVADAVAVFADHANALWIFGGTTLGFTPSDTLQVLDGAGWSQFTPAPRPSARTEAAGAYDRRRGELVVFGGSSDSGLVFPPPPALADTWIWDGAVWTPLAGGPPGRSGAAATYDEVRDRIVLYGGQTAIVDVFGGAGLDLAVFNDTWEWDGATRTWANVTPSSGGPGPRTGAQLVYDSRMARSVLIGGSESATELWSWDGQDWTLVPTDTAASSTYAPSATYDEVNGEIVVVEGTTTTRGRLSSVTPPEACVVAVDLDADGAAGCADPDCGAVCRPMCPGEVEAAGACDPMSATPRCGDAICAGAETCRFCPDDCGACPPWCGDGFCDGTEAVDCPGDCSPA